MIIRNDAAVAESEECWTTARRLHHLCFGAWPLVGETAATIPVVVDSSAVMPGNAGLVLEDGVLEKYVESLDPRNPIRRMVERYNPERIVLVDHAEAVRNGGWPSGLLTAAHEVAHVARDELARTLYPTPDVLTKTTRVLESIRRDCPQLRPDLPNLFVDDQDSRDHERWLMPSAGKDPLLGRWAIRTDQHDGVHDLLFYLLLYVMERGLDDAGQLARDVPFDRSIYLPGKVECVLPPESSGVLASSGE